MAFNIQIPGSIDFTKCKFTEKPSTTKVNQRSCYSYQEKLSQVTNPLCLHNDVIYPSAMAAATQFTADSNNSGTLAVGCKGHQIDNEFPLESRTPFALPLVMYPLPIGVKNRRCHHEIDLCSLPVLNWEAYVKDVKTSLTISLPIVAPKLYGRKIQRDKKSGVGQQCQEEQMVREDEEEKEDSSCAEDMESDANTCTNRGRRKNKNDKIKPKEFKTKIAEVDQSSFPKLMRLRHALIDSEKHVINPEETEEDRKKRFDKIHSLMMGHGAVGDDDNKNDKPANSFEYEVRELKRKKLPVISLYKMQNRPKLIIEGTWNHLYGGLGGACCFVKTGSSTNSCEKFYVFVGKGSQLRAVKLKTSSQASMFKYTIDSVWEESSNDVPSNAGNRGDSEPFSDLIFQIVPTRTNDILGVRRGKSINIYSTEETAPYLLESVSNTLYGTNEYYPDSFPKNMAVGLIKDPLLLGLDFSPTCSSECITMDENWVVRICDFTQGSTNSLFAVPRDPSSKSHGTDYPTFQLNNAAGVSYAHVGKLFYAWGSSVVYLGDQRSTSSSSHFLPLFDLQKNIYSQALTDQNFFHTNPAFLNEYVSCLKKSSREMYYYVGTTSKIYLMDMRVPSHPVIKISHGMQAPLTYLDTYSDENFEIVVGGSQRVPETVALATDHAHVHCYDRPGCTSKNPILHCYPRHLSNSREYFDVMTKYGHGFSMPVDQSHVKNRHYAWTTGLSLWPSRSSGNPRIPRGVIVVTSNNFGDIFWQEWDQKPVPSHKKTDVEEIRLQSFVSGWKKAMTPNISIFDKPKPSCNTRTFVDCSLMMDTLAKEIERLSKIRDSPFDCFKPNQLQYDRNLRNMLSTEELMFKLRKYKGDKAQAVVDVWTEQSQTCDSEDMEPVEIKEEPQEMIWSSSSSINTIHDMDATHGLAENVLNCSILEDDEESGALEIVNDSSFKRSSSNRSTELPVTFQPEEELITGDIYDSDDARDIDEVFESSQPCNVPENERQHSQSSICRTNVVNPEIVNELPNSNMPIMEDEDKLFMTDYQQRVDDYKESLQFETDYGYSQYHESPSDTHTFGIFPDFQDSQASSCPASAQSKQSSVSYQWKKSSKRKKSGFL
ncbi:unnamed protein product [Orchesella dallaii]|uniref:TATA box-binding protein-associated factor RNA polymerase I subunit C n=1 Tax=Orchesella dallaii TaxID=48710 RepID=A0ABP1Q2C4_9HEXA